MYFCKISYCSILKLMTTYSYKLHFDLVSIKKNSNFVFLKAFRTGDCTSYKLSADLVSVLKKINFWHFSKLDSASYMLHGDKFAKYCHLFVSVFKILVLNSNLWRYCTGFCALQQPQSRIGRLLLHPVTKSAKRYMQVQD